MINSKTSTLYIFALLIVSLFFSGCKSHSNSQLTDTVDVTKPKFCAAIRGNGQYIFTHFGSLARIVEEYGILDGVAGGSSASLTAFIYESMRMNPLLVKYSEDGRQLKMSLMLKSLLGYLESLNGTDEYLALSGTQVLGQILADKGIVTLESDNSDRARSTFNIILTDPNVRRMINPEVFTILAGRDSPPYKSVKFKIEEIQLSASTLVAFTANDQKILFREGLVNMKTVTDFIGRIADFYAGSKHVDLLAMETFFNECGDAGSRGLDWTQIVDLDRGTRTCGRMFTELVVNYRAELQKHNFVTAKSRLDDPMGIATDSIIFSAYVENVSSSVTSAPQDYKAALARYRSGREPAYNVDFNDVHFGYWTTEKWKSTLAAGIAQSSDAKTKKYRQIAANNPTWRDILPLSIMEPGLSRMVVVEPSRVFIGGWADLHPVQPLKAAGCDEVIYVTREGPESSFVSEARPLTPSSLKNGVAELLNLTPDQQHELYAADNSESSYRKAVSSADAVWCTNWDSVSSFDFTQMFNHSYNSRIAPKTDRFKKSNAVTVVPPPLLGCY